VHHLCAHSRRDLDKPVFGWNAIGCQLWAPVGSGDMSFRACVDDAGEFDGAAGLRVDSAGPGDSTDKRPAERNSPGPAVEHVEEPFLFACRMTFRGLPFSSRSAWMSGCVASYRSYRRSRLESPGEFACAGFHCKDADV